MSISNTNNFTPENMLRLARLSMPNIVRNKVFLEFAMDDSSEYNVTFRYEDFFSSDEKFDELNKEYYL